jgi:hypothetical protein
MGGAQAAHAINREQSPVLNRALFFYFDAFSTADKSTQSA